MRSITPLGSLDRVAGPSNLRIILITTYILLSLLN